MNASWRDKQIQLLKERKFEDLDVANLISFLGNIRYSSDFAFASTLRMLISTLIKLALFGIVVSKEKRLTWVTDAQDIREELRNMIDERPELANSRHLLFKSAMQEASAAIAEAYLIPGMSKSKDEVMKDIEAIGLNYDKAIDPSFIPSSPT